MGKQQKNSTRNCLSLFSRVGTTNALFRPAGVRFLSTQSLGASLTEISFPTTEIESSLFTNRVSLINNDLGEEITNSFEEEAEIYLDSVKRKRYKKMKKHKHRKLLKRTRALRRKL